MTLETFFEKFNQFADAPDAVAKMRELILESAIRGMLVPHNASDEPASELLKRIARLQDGQARKQAALPSVGDDAYLEIPPGWEWTRLGNTGRIFNGDSVSESGKAELAKVEDGLPFIATKDVGYGRAALVYVNGLKVPLRDPRFKVARANAVLICAEGGSAGRKIGVTDRDICFGNKLFANEVWEGIHHRYVFYVYQAPTFFKEFAARMTGIIGGIARSEFLSLPFPLPPLGEQRRIVAKMDELMALCDRLEAQQQERETRHAALARASLARFADAPTPANLNFIFHKSYAITPADLRKSILTLAVQGKLVPQDPNDEPADELIARLEREVPRLAKQQGVRSPKNIPPLASDNFPHDIPESWRWSRIGNLALLIDYGTSQKSHSDSSKVPVYRMGNIVGGRLLDENLKYVDASIDDLPGLYLKTDDILFNRTNSYELVGKTGIFAGRDDTATFASYLIRIRLPSTLLFPKFYSVAMNAQYFRQTQIEPEVVQQCGQANFNGTKLASTVVPIPPLAEQRRIVAKVEQLMALVDALETQLAASRATAANLLSALVAELTGTPNNGKVSVPSVSTTGRRGRPPKS